ncbi:sirohydrochlorin chelatase [Laceyella putida]|uniref:Sirohydrochlorin chelatase n=1 Tax=Laceyella putida TaxID=110101 RepID=A0ABW2RHD0_9BACL
MEAILFVGHGSRDAEGNRELLRFTEKMAPQFAEPIVETCFLELAEPDMGAGVKRAVERGATSIKVVPLMLFMAGHAKVHIPLFLHEAQAQYPHVRFTYGRPLEVDELILPILEARIQQAAGANEAEETSILLVGRGSSDAGANSDLYKIARLLWERLNVPWVEACFIGVTDPRMEAGLERCVRLGAKRVVVLPYFLFTGVLIKRMEKMVRQFNEESAGVHAEMVPYLGFDDGLVPIWQRRVHQLAHGQALNWQALAEQAIAAGHHQHHHDHDHHHGHHHA